MRPGWEIRAIQWLVRRLRERGVFKLRFGHSLVLEQPEPEMYMEVVYGDDETVVFDMGFPPQMWPQMRRTMEIMEERIEQEYEEVRGDD